MSTDHMSMGLLLQYVIVVLVVLVSVLAAFRKLAPRPASDY